MIFSFMRAVAVFILAAIASVLCNEQLISTKVEGSMFKRAKKRFIRALIDVIKNPKNYIFPGILAIVSFVVRYFSPKMEDVKIHWGFAVLLEAIMLALMIVLMIWWHREGSNWKEFIFFATLSIMFFFSAEKNAKVVWIKLENRGHSIAASLFDDLPTMMLVVSLGFFILDGLYFYYDRKINPEKYLSEAEIEPEINLVEDEELKSQVERLINLMEKSLREKNGE